MANQGTCYSCHLQEGSTGEGSLASFQDVLQWLEVPLLVFLFSRSTLGAS